MGPRGTRAARPQPGVPSLRPDAHSRQPRRPPPSPPLPRPSAGALQPPPRYAHAPPGSWRPGPGAAAARGVCWEGGREPAREGGRRAAAPRAPPPPPPSRLAGPSSRRFPPPSALPLQDIPARPGRRGHLPRWSCRCGGAAGRRAAVPGEPAPREPRAPAPARPGPSPARSLPPPDRRSPQPGALPPPPPR